MNSKRLHPQHVRPFRVGVLRGEGSGPELIDAALRVLEAVVENRGLKFQIETGGEIGSLSARRNGEYLSGEVIEFCRKIFDASGAILAGAAGGRFVYDMRRRFNLYYKLNPLRSYPELRDVCRIKLPAKAIDVLLVRENLQGIYQGDSVENSSEDGREVSHTFVHNEKQVRAVLEVAAAVARSRRNLLTVIGKNSGAPAVHALWGACAMEVGQAANVEFSMLDVDYAAYKLLQEPESFDVIAAPNCFGDILSDLGGVLAGSRGLTFWSELLRGRRRDLSDKSRRRLRPCWKRHGQSGGTDFFGGNDAERNVWFANRSAVGRRFSARGLAQRLEDNRPGRTRLQDCRHAAIRRIGGRRNL